MLSRALVWLGVVTASAVLVWGEVSVSCGAEGPEEPVTLTVTPLSSPAGRVLVRQCGAALQGAVRWRLELRALRHLSPQACRLPAAARMDARPHSDVVEELDRHDTLRPNCSHLCISRPLDLVVSGCYRLQSLLEGAGPRYKRPDTSLHYVSNNLTSPDYFTNDQPLYNDVPGEHLEVTWYGTKIPIEEHRVEIFRDDKGCQKPCTTKQSNDSLFLEEFQSMDVSGNCTLTRASAGQASAGQASAGSKLQCSLQPGPGCYRLALRHRAPWIHSPDYRADIAEVQTLPLCHTGGLRAAAVAVPQPPYSGAAGVGAVGAGGVLAAVVLAALLWTLRRRGQRKGRPVSPEREQFVEDPAEPYTLPARPRVLLLHAREPPPGHTLFTALKDLLDVAARPGEVVDLYAPETVNVSAETMTGWLRGVMTSPDTRLLLVQSPALQAIRPTAHQGPNGPHLVYKEPHPMDGILLQALRLLEEGVDPAPLPYRRRFLAHLSDLPMDILPHVVPFARYHLPQAALRLLSDLTDRQLSPDDELLTPKLASFESAVTAFIQHIRSEHERGDNYLRAQLEME